MRKILLVVALSCALMSCGAEPTEPDGASSPGAGAAGAADGRTTPVAGSAAEEAPVEETTASGVPDAEAQAPVAPALREGPARRSTPDRPALGANGMVSSAHPLATRAGLEVLEDGGNAYDAAVAVAATLGVVEPYMSGVGGYGATVVYDAGSGRVRSLSASTRAPETLDPAVFRPPTPGYRQNRVGAAAISTPGAVNDWEALWEEYGEMRWERLLQPAIGHAEEGFVLDEENAGWIGEQYSSFPANAQRIYGRGGAPLAAGERLVQEDLGRSLRLISSRGADAVYDGELGEAMVSATRANGGFLTADDLRANEPRWQEPVSIDYRGDEVATAPTPTTAWNTLTRLGTMGRLDPASLGHNTPEYLRAYAAVTEQASYERQEYAASPDVASTPLDRLLSQNYFEQQAAAARESSGPAAGSSASSSASASASASASPTASAGTSGGAPELASAENADLSRDLSGQQGHTTHFVVADREGNVVTMTQTIGDIFGSKVMPEGTGIWLNNSIRYADFNPPGNPLDAFPGRYRLPNISPTIILRDDQPRVALGAHGGQYISQTMAQMIMNLTDFDMDIQRTISEPRIAFLEPNLLAVDAGVPADARNALAASGYEVFQDEYGLGNAHGLTVEYGENGGPVRFTGGADPRARGVAAGY